MDRSRYFRVESHVAQKSRRNKLRIQQNSVPNLHLEGCTNTMEHSSAHHELPATGKFEPLSYDPNPFSSEMLSYLARNSHLLLPQNNVLVSDQESGSTQFNRPTSSVSFAHLSHQIPPKVIADPQNSTNWKSMASQQSCGSDVNYSNGFTGIDQCNPNNFSSSTLYTRPSSFGYHQHLDSLNTPAAETSGQRLNSQKNYGDLTHLGSSSFCQNLQEVASSIAIEAQELEMASISPPHTSVRGNNSNELPLLPAYGDQTNTLQLSNDPRWIKRSCVDRHQQNVNSVSNADKSIQDTTIIGNDSCSTQGLSLSLSSIPRTNNLEGGFWGGDYQNIPSRHRSLINEVTEHPLKADLLCNLNSKGFVGTKPVENNRPNVVSMSGLARSTGPIGPFTGYATILKSSKYLKLTQQLLSESCFIGGQDHIEACETYSQNISEDARITGENVVRAKGSDCGASSAALYCTNKNSSGSLESYRPEFQQKKAKLLYMLDEMCRRYRQHHQQMQMVVSSFKSVAGLSSATPYISHALKAVTKHFRCLKNAITMQLSQTRKALGEDLSSPITGTGSSKGDTTGTSRLRCFDHGFQKQNKSGEGFFEPQQPVWRHQRGLPERAVSVLRAWLFDHFLHPYPTDTDKHMLATKTGLTRNQVSNWFINARVRLWKPMVEEIHSLETKTLEERNSNPVQVVSMPPSEGANRMRQDALTTSRLLRTNSTSNTQVEWSENNSVTLARIGGDEATAEFWNQKRSRIECQVPDGMDGSMLCFEPYQPRGLGGVSLTLGLRQSAEYAQQQLQHSFDFT